MCKKLFEQLQIKNNHPNKYKELEWLQYQVGRISHSNFQFTVCGTTSPKLLRISIKQTFPYYDHVKVNMGKI